MIEQRWYIISWFDKTPRLVTSRGNYFTSYKAAKIEAADIATRDSDMGELEVVSTADPNSKWS